MEILFYIGQIVLTGIALVGIAKYWLKLVEKDNKKIKYKAGDIINF